MIDSKEYQFLTDVIKDNITHVITTSNNESILESYIKKRFRIEGCVILRWFEEIYDYGTSYAYKEVYEACSKNPFRDLKVTSDVYFDFLERNPHILKECTKHYLTLDSESLDEAMIIASNHLENDIKIYDSTNFIKANKEFDFYNSVIEKKLFNRLKKDINVISNKLFDFTIVKEYHSIVLFRNSIGTLVAITVPTFDKNYNHLNLRFDYLFVYYPKDIQNIVASKCRNLLLKEEEYWIDYLSRCLDHSKNYIFVSNNLNDIIDEMNSY